MMAKKEFFSVIAEEKDLPAELSKIEGKKGKVLHILPSSMETANAGGMNGFVKVVKYNIIYEYQERGWEKA